MRTLSFIDYFIGNLTYTSTKYNLYDKEINRLPVQRFQKKQY